MYSELFLVAVLLALYIWLANVTAHTVYYSAIAYRIDGGNQGEFRFAVQNGETVALKPRKGGKLRVAVSLDEGGRLASEPRIRCGHQPETNLDPAGRLLTLDFPELRPLDTWVIACPASSPTGKATLTLTEVDQEGKEIARLLPLLRNASIEIGIGKRDFKGPRTRPTRWTGALTAFIAVGAYLELCVFQAPFLRSVPNWSQLGWLDAILVVALGLTAIALRHVVSRDPPAIVQGYLGWEGSGDSPRSNGAPRASLVAKEVDKSTA